MADRYFEKGKRNPVLPKTIKQNKEETKSFKRFKNSERKRKVEKAGESRGKEKDKMLKDKIKAEIRSALKSGKKEKVIVLRMLLSNIINKEKEKRYKLAKENPGLEETELQEQSELQDKEVLGLIFSEVKKRRDTIADFRKGDRKDLANKEEKEIKILERYLPEQLSESEIKEKAVKTINELGATDIKDIGKVMALLITRLKGRARGDIVNKVVRDLLSGK